MVQPAPPPVPPSARERLHAAVRTLYPTFRYWMLTEVHVYAVAISANMLLSFFPFLIVMVSLFTNVFHWTAGAEAVYFTVGDYFPGQIGKPIVDELRNIAHTQGGVQAVSLLLLLFTANGVFVPMEVALNHIWGCKENRSYLRNQMVSAGLIFACGLLAMLSTLFTAMNNTMLEQVVGPNEITLDIVGLIACKFLAIPLSIISLFLIYWLLPNRRIDPRQLLPAAIRVAILLEVLKYGNLFTWSWLSAKLKNEYGPFEYAVAIILWGFLASMLILGGAEWASRRNAPVPPRQQSALGSEP